MKGVVKREDNPSGRGKPLDSIGKVLRSEINPEVFGWIPETISAVAIRPDNDVFDCVSDNLKPISGIIKNIHYRENATTPGPMGVLASIGSSVAMETADWLAVHGVLFEYIASPDNWFNIYDSAELEGYDYKPIITGTGGNVYFVRRALFAYDSDLFKWILIEYTPAFWGNTYGIVGAANTDIEVASSLPQVGYYHFDVNVSVLETEDGDPTNTGSAQILTVKSSGNPTTGATATADVSPTYDPGMVVQTKMVNSFLQGSGLIYVDYDSLGALKMYVNVTLPNGDTQIIVGGDLHLKYHGKLINY